MSGGNPGQQLPVCEYCGYPMAEDARPGWRHLCTEGLALGIGWRDSDA